MSLFFALMLIGLPAAALVYDFRKGGINTRMLPAALVPKSAATDKTE